MDLEELNWFDLFSGQELIYQYPHGDIIVNVVAAYISRYFRGKLKIDRQEGDELRFFNLNELPLAISPPDKPIIKKYLRTING